MSDMRFFFFYPPQVPFILALGEFIIKCSCDEGEKDQVNLVLWLKWLHFILLFFFKILFYF